MAPLNSFNQNNRQIKAIANSSWIFVVYPGGMSCYDPMFNKWSKKAALSTTIGTKFSVYLLDHQLKAASYGGGPAVAFHRYEPSTNAWKFAGVSIFGNIQKVYV